MFKLKSKYTDEERAIARSLRPIDDTLFRTMAKDNIPFVEHIETVVLMSRVNTPK